MDNFFFGTEAESRLQFFVNDCITKKKRIFLLCDENTEKYCLPILQSLSKFAFLDKFVLKSGENSKSIDNATLIWIYLLEQRADKDAVLVALGGGVVTDLAGFVAANFKRGIDLVLLPTSLIGQVDAALGGKNAVNIDNAKNQIGTFKKADIIFIFPQFISTLPKIEIFSGFAEMLKHALIVDAVYWEKLKDSDFTIDMINNELILTSVNIKSQICQQDRFENHLRKKLNFGHTIGHAIECYYLSNNQSIPHGHAVAEGMLSAAYISYLKNMLYLSQLQEIKTVIRRFFPPLSIPKNDYSLIYQYTLSDKKHSSQSANFTLLTSIGQSIVNQDVSKKEIIEAMIL
ncbi:MAG: 3-dehydroquinate synthase [Bacteroidales bacterium]|jgi:3-dehydroquinate synthase|nr:3-dehydroquinate synthase [Bacteroidales bacterium]